MPQAPLAPLTDPDYLPHILELIFTFLPDSGLAKCLRVSKSFQALAAPLLYSHLVLSETCDPFKGLDVYNPTTRERTDTPSITKMELLAYTKSIDIRGHEDDTCKRFAAGGWRLPKFQVLQLREPIKQKAPDRENTTGTVQSMTNHRAPPKHPHPRACRILSDLCPRTLVVFDLNMPNSKSGHPLGLQTLPLTIEKAVLVLDASAQRGFLGFHQDAIFHYLPTETKEVVCVFSPLQKERPPGGISTLINAIVEMITYADEKQYTMVNVEALQLQEMDGMDAGEKLQRFMEPLSKCLEHYLRDRDRVDEVLGQIRYMSLEEYLRHAANEFQPDDVRMLRRV